MSARPIQPEPEPPREVRRLLHGANNHLATLLSHAEAGLLSGEASAMRDSLETVCRAAEELAATLKDLRTETAIEAAEASSGS